MNFSNFDWIQWYSFVWLVINCIALLDTEISKTTQTERIINLFLGLPMFGRILGWW